MSGGGTAAVTIQQELKGLFTNTANVMQGLQNYCWEKVKGLTTRCAWSPYSTQSQSNTRASNNYGNQAGSTGSLSRGTDAVGLGEIYIALVGETYTVPGGDIATSSAHSGGQEV